MELDCKVTCGRRKHCILCIYLFIDINSNNTKPKLIVSCCFLCCYFIAVVLRICRCEYVTQVWRENQARSFAAHFHHAGTGSLTCCLATDCNNLQFTFETAAAKSGRLAGEICRCMIYGLFFVCVDVWQTPGVCIHL